MTVIIGVDFETTGLNPDEDRITEAAFVAWDVEQKQPIKMKSYLVSDPEPPCLTPEITEITGITTDMLIKYAYTSGRVILDFAELNQLLEPAFWVAHNAPFEIEFLAALSRRSDSGLSIPDNWIDTKVDIQKHEGKRLIHAAAEEGILNPFPHRALPDVLTMLALLSRFDFEEIATVAQSPPVKLFIGFFKWDETGVKQEAAKSLGFRWHGKSKHWFKDTKRCYLDEIYRQNAEMGLFTIHEASKDEELMLL